MYVGHGRPQLFWKGGGGGGGGGGQDRARGSHLTAAYTLSAFGRFNQWEGTVRFRPIQPVGGGGGGCQLSADSVNEVSALSADSISGRWMLSAFSQFSQWGCACMYTRGGGGGGGGGGAPFSPEGGATHVGGWMNVD